MTVEHVRFVFNLVGLSTDTKPDTFDGQSVGPGSTFFEKDTNSTYKYDGNSWNQETIAGAALVTDGIFSQPIDDTGTYTYIGKAPAATDGATAAWLVARVTNSTGSIYYAGTGAADQVWDNRASLTYTEA